MAIIPLPYPVWPEFSKEQVNNREDRLKRGGGLPFELMITGSSSVGYELIPAPELKLIEYAG